MSESAWTRARAVLDAMQGTHADRARVLEDRARRLAAPLAEAEHAPEEALAVACGGRTVWIGMGWVRRVHELRRVTRLPGSSPFLLGVARFHRRLLPVFDVGALVGERACRLSPLEARLVEIGKGEGELVLAAESTAGTVVLDGRIARVGGQAGLVAAVGPGGEVVIDCDELLADPRFGAGAAPRSVT